MSSPIRGRALIINNMSFDTKEEKYDWRDGSDVDMSNMRSLLSKLSFEQTVATDFAAEVNKCCRCLLSYAYMSLKLYILTQFGSKLAKHLLI